MQPYKSIKCLNDKLILNNWILSSYLPIGPIESYWAQNMEYINTSTRGRIRYEKDPVENILLYSNGILRGTLFNSTSPQYREVGRISYLSEVPLSSYSNLIERLRYDALLDMTDLSEDIRSSLLRIHIFIESIINKSFEGNVRKELLLLFDPKTITTHKKLFLFNPKIVIREMYRDLDKFLINLHNQYLFFYKLLSNTTSSINDILVHLFSIPVSDIENLIVVYHEKVGDLIRERDLINKSNKFTFHHKTINNPECISITSFRNMCIEPFSETNTFLPIISIEAYSQLCFREGIRSKVDYYKSFTLSKVSDFNELVRFIQSNNLVGINLINLLTRINLDTTVRTYFLYRFLGEDDDRDFSILLNNLLSYQDVEDILPSLPIKYLRDIFTEIDMSLVNFILKSNKRDFVIKNLNILLQLIPSNLITKFIINKSLYAHL